MFLRESSFHELMSRFNVVDDLYKSILDDDCSKAVKMALQVIKKNHISPPLLIPQKDKESSIEHRQAGNIAYQTETFKLAFLEYNKALLLAPKNSLEMKLAFSNRSALFQKIKAYHACIKDIDMCLAMGCPPDIVEKLKKRKRAVELCESLKSSENHLLATALCRKYTECTFNNHELPCASSDVKVQNSGIPKIVAANNIKIGSVLASETAYVSTASTDKNFLCCHHCQRMSLNLIPCDQCVHALFCDDECKTKSFDEYHIYECFLMDLLRNEFDEPQTNLMLKATLKLRAKCNVWRELIDSSYEMGIDKIKTSSVKDIFDSESQFSVLCQRDDRPFIYGTKYNASFVCAILLNYLEQIPSFFPKDVNESKEAKNAIARIMMFLTLHTAAKEMYQAVKDCNNDKNGYYETHNFGLFSFAGKLHNSCTPNVIAVQINNKSVLIALQSIKKGEELTISFQRHWLDACYKERHNSNINNYKLNGKVCSCYICTGENPLNQQLTKLQRTFYEHLNLENIHNSLNFFNLDSIYKTLLEALDKLRFVPQSQEYKNIYRVFKKCLFTLELTLSNNDVL